MARVSRFKQRDSDRSGFTYPERELIKDKGRWVHPEELDVPPPSKRSLGGEGEIAQGQMRTSTATTIPTENENPTAYITAAGGITPNIHPYMRITGSNAAVTVTANPQIVAGKQSQVLTIFCVGSDVTLSHGTGLNLMGSAGFVMRSGAILTCMYNSGDTAWQEVSRLSYGGFGG